jgi:hypothetical protein
VTQIADGENGGVMMNEFPSAYIQAHQRLAAEGGSPQSSAPRTVALNGSEYLQLLASTGIDDRAFAPIQAVQQHRLWQSLNRRSTAGNRAVTSGTAATTGTAATAGLAAGLAADRAADTAAAIAELEASDGSFSMAGASWTNNLSWVEGYTNVLQPMQELSARFHQRFDALVAADPGITATAEYQQALLHLLLLETSCFRYWGQGTWTDYATTLHRRGLALLGGDQGSVKPD